MEIKLIQCEVELSDYLKNHTLKKGAIIIQGDYTYLFKETLSNDEILVESTRKEGLKNTVLNISVNSTFLKTKCVLEEDIDFKNIQQLDLFEKGTDNG